tara:strand:+ start:1151 stop:1747 length:597 start_codon:yes stop_codon:yes gene_type:complete
MYIYYSNHCNKSKELLNFLYKSPFRNKFKYVNIDNRIKENNQIFILLNNGQKFPLPSQIRNVPTLLNPESGEIYVGDQIKSFLVPSHTKIQRQMQEVNEDPDAFTFGSNGGGNAYGVMSDSFSFLNQSEKEMKADGSGGMRQMYNYVSLNNYNQTINTPQDEDNDERGSKMRNVNLEQLEHQRNQDLEKMNNNQKMVI